MRSSALCLALILLLSAAQHPALCASVTAHVDVMNSGDHFEGVEREQLSLVERLFRTRRHTFSPLHVCISCCNCCKHKGCGVCCRT